MIFRCGGGANIPQPKTSGQQLLTVDPFPSLDVRAKLDEGTILVTKMACN